jgi:cyclophilin family peptidyl-prolyl cis-trans isomerase
MLLIPSSSSYFLAIRCWKTPAVQAALFAAVLFAATTVLHASWQTNAPNYPGSTRGEKVNSGAFAALKQDGSVVAWGDPQYGGSLTNPVDVTPYLSNGVVSVYSSGQAFAAFKQNGSVVAWGSQESGGDVTYPVNVSAKLTSGVGQIFSTFDGNGGAFAALKTNGSVIVWGDPQRGGSITVPVDVSSQLTNGVIDICSTESAFAALKNDGSVLTWGDSSSGGSRSSLAGFIRTPKKIFSTSGAFAVLNQDGTVGTWGDPTRGGDSSSVQGNLSSVTNIYATYGAFAALSQGGSVVTWGDPNAGGDSSSVATLLTNGVVTIVSTDTAFAAIKSNGSVVSWGDLSGQLAYGYPPTNGYPTNLLTGVSSIFASQNSFAALKSGKVIVWGDSGSIETYLTNAPAGITSITPSAAAGLITSGGFAALGSGGSVLTWGDSVLTGSNAPAASVVTSVASGAQQVYGNGSAFAALMSNGSVVTWGDGIYGGDSSAVSNRLSSGVQAIASPFIRIKGAVQVIPTDWTTNAAFSGLVYSTNASITLSNLFALPYATTNRPSSIQLTASGGCALIATNGNGTFTIRFTGAGPVTLTASQAGDTNFRAAIPVSTSFTVDRGQQSVAFAGISNNLLVYSTNKAANPVKLALPAGSTVGIPLYPWSATGNARLTNGSYLQMLHAGSFTLTVSASGNSNYYSLPSWTYTNTIAQGSQSITLPAFPASTYPTNSSNAMLLAPVLPAASSIGGLPVSFSLSPTSPGLLTNNRILVTGAGTITLTGSNSGSFAGFSDYRPISVTNTLIVAKASHAITFPATPAVTYSNGAVVNLTARSSASLPVTLSCANTNVVSVDSNPVVVFFTTQGSFAMQLLPTNAPATVANFLRYVDSGAYLGTFIDTSVSNGVIQAGGYKALVNAGKVVTNAAAIPTFPPVTNEFANSGLSNLAGTVAMVTKQGDSNSATSAWFVNLTNNSALDASNGGHTVFARLISNGISIVGAIASDSATNLPGTYTAQLTNVPVQGIINGQTVRSTNLVTITNVATLYPVTIMGSGTATIVASQGGNANWNNAASVTNKLVVNQASQTITIASVGTQIYSPGGSFTIHATASGGGSVTNFVSSNTNVLTLINAGSNTVTALIRGAGAATITARIPAQGNYIAATASTNLVIAKAANPISAIILNPALPSYTTNPLTKFTLAATAPGGPVTFSSGNAKVVSVSGTNATVLGAGSVTLTATQGGNANYFPNSTTLPLVISKAP